MWDKITRFAGEKLDQAKGAVTNELKYAAKQLRDKVVVPAIDSGMEAGVIPSDAGMFGRYLTGTEVPLTKTPNDIKAAEAVRAANFAGNDVYQKRKDKYHSIKTKLEELTPLQDDSIVSDEAKIKDLLAQQKSSGINIRDHRMGVGSPQNPKAVQDYITREKQIQRLQSKWPDTLHLGEGNQLSTDASTYDVKGTIKRLTEDLKDYSNYKVFKGATPSNYTSDSYNPNAADATTNSLGRYEVKDGVIVDRYDFNWYKKPGKFTNGVVVGNDDTYGLKNNLTNAAGGLADKLGLIKPGHGYDVKLKVR